MIMEKLHFICNITEIVYKCFQRQLRMLTLMDTKPYFSSSLGNS